MKTGEKFIENTASPASGQWHGVAADSTAQAFDSPESGLSPDEAGARLRKFGANQLAAARPLHPLLRLLRQFHNLLLYLMMTAGIITALLGQWVDAGVLWGAVLVNALIGFVQEGRAEQALSAIRGMLAPHATVIRDGRRQVIDAADLVPGDRVLVASGDRIPADLRLVQARELRVDEASLDRKSVV